MAVLATEVLLWFILIGLWLAASTLESSFRFARPQMLWLLAGSTVVPIVFLAMLRWKDKALERFADAPLLLLMVPHISPFYVVLRLVLFRVGLAMILAGLSMPQYGVKEVEGSAEGIDLMVAVDVSNSMRAEDLTPNRMEQARLSIEQIVQELKGDRVGIVTFAGVADVHIPVTGDYNAVKSFISSIDTDFPIQGTAIGAAIKTSIGSFDMENSSNKAIVILSDGENHEDDALEAAAAALEKGVIVHTIGMGSPQGVPIPIYRNGRQVGYKENQTGEKVVTRLNEKMLQDISTAGGGVYVRADQSRSAVNLIIDALDQLEETKLDTGMYMEYEDHFYIFLIIGTFLIIIEACIPEKKDTPPNRSKLQRA